MRIVTDCAMKNCRPNNVGREERKKKGGGVIEMVSEVIEIVSEVIEILFEKYKNYEISYR